MKLVSLKDKIVNVIKKSEAIFDENKKNAADIDYIAMMCDVDLDSDEGVQEDEQEL